MAYETAGLAPALEVFAAVARTGSVTAAAAELGMPQPTVSRIVGRLAGELGVALLTRDGRGIRLTRQGAVLAEHGERALRELRAAVAAVRADADPDSGHVVLGFLHSMGPRAVPSLLRSFRDAHPEVTIGLVQDAADTVLDGVVAGTVDLALASPVPHRPELRSRALARQPLVALVPRGHRLAARPRLVPADLVADPLITMRAGYGVRTMTDALLRAAGLPRRYAFESDELTTVAGLVAAGLGVAVLPLGAGEGTAAVEIPLKAAGSTRVISVAWSAQRAATPPVLALRRHLIEQGPAVLGTASARGRR